MDTTAQNKVSDNQQPQQNGSSATDSGQARLDSAERARMTTDTSQQQPVVQTPTQSVSVPAGKEGAPQLRQGYDGQDMISPVKPAEQWVQETAPKANLAPALAEAGVEASKSEVLEVAPDVAQAGVKATGAATPIPTEPTFHFPMTEEEALKKSSSPGKTKLSAAWLAMLVLRQIKMIRFGQKKKEEKK